uniref:Diacylglycerol kinase n=1 Tax=Lepisosteus oculatus TaxID=7918 RepID=W5M733_LEPOC
EMGDRSWVCLSPAEFAQLQQYTEYSTKKLKDVLEEFHDDGVLSKYNPEQKQDVLNQPIDYEGFQLFMKTYLENDIPQELCQHLFTSFKRKTAENSPEPPRTGGGLLGKNTPVPSADLTLPHCCPLLAELFHKTSLCVKRRRCVLWLTERITVTTAVQFCSLVHDPMASGDLQYGLCLHLVFDMLRMLKNCYWKTNDHLPSLGDYYKVQNMGNVLTDSWIRAELGIHPSRTAGEPAEGQEVEHLIIPNNRPLAFCSYGGTRAEPDRSSHLCCLLCTATRLRRLCAKGCVLFCASCAVPAAREKLFRRFPCVNTDRALPACALPIQHVTRRGSVCCCNTTATWSAQPVWGDPQGQIKGGRQLHCQIKAPLKITGLAAPHRTRSSAPGSAAVDNTTFTHQSRQRPTGRGVSVCSGPAIAPPSVHQQQASGFWFTLSPSPSVFHRLNFFHDVPDFRVLACGGDGTVGWILDCIDKANYTRHPPVAVLPLGTGNDLARCLRWGGGYEGGNLMKFLRDIEHSTEVVLDRWSIDVIPNNKEEKGDPVPYSIVNNYFSIGVDASIAHRFHLMREKHPEKFNSRMKNKLWYFEFGTTETISATCKKLNESLEVECDGIILDLSSTSLEGIAVLNIPSMHGGSNLWGETKKRRNYNRMSKKVPERAPVSTVTDAKELKFCVQDLSDQLLEVVGLEGAIEMGQIYTGLKSAGRRLAQCASVTIRTSRLMPMQIDGEPWMQPPCTIKITHKNQVPMLLGPPQKTPFFFFKRRNRSRD